MGCTTSKATHDDQDFTELIRSPTRASMSHRSIQPISASSVFLETPSEIRHRIFLLLAIDEKFGTLGSLLRVNQTLHSEVLPFIYRDVHISSKATYSALLGALDAQVSRKKPGKGRGRGAREKNVAATEESEASMESLLDNFRMTKRITLHDMPYFDYGRELDKRVKTLGVDILCPNATFLYIKPDSTRTTFKPSLEGSMELSPPSFLRKLCQPKHVCMDTVSGCELQDDTSRHLATTMIESVCTHLPPDTWTQEPVPEMHWHGDFVTAYTPQSDILTKEKQRFPHIHMYNHPFYMVPSGKPRIDTSDVCARLLCASVAFNDFSCFVRPTPSITFHVETPACMFDSSSTSTAAEETAPDMQQCIEEIDGLIISCSKLLGQGKHVQDLRARSERMKALLPGYFQHLAAIRQFGAPPAREALEVQRQMMEIRTIIVKALNDATLTSEELSDSMIRIRHTQAWCTLGLVMDEHGKERLKDVTFKMGKDRIPCPVCTYRPY